MDDGTSSSCQTRTGNDFVYILHVESPLRVTFTTSGALGDAILYVRETTCTSPAAEIACNDDISSSNRHASVTVELTPGKSYFLFVDGYNSNQGAYTLTITTECGSGYIAGSTPGSCIPDPCDPNPCTLGDRTKCVVESEAYRCDCRPGTIDSGVACIPDPNLPEWTFMVYLNADNNLESYGYDDLSEMTRVGSDANVKIVVLMDSYSRDSGASRYLYINPGSSTVVRNLGEADMGNWQTLRDFGVWAVQNYPARKYALVLWDHGDGWRKVASKAPLTKGFSNDEHGNYDGISIANGEYARALEGITDVLGGKLDLVGFDACLMGMYEVASATAPYGRVLVASSEVEPADGWTYDDFLADLKANPTMTPAQLATYIVDSYADASSSNSTLGATDLDSMPALQAAVSTFADELRTSSSLWTSIETQRANTQTFEDETFRDLQHFAQRIQALSSAPPALQGAAQGVMTQMGSSVIHFRYRGSSYANSHGLSIYFPSRSASMESAYRGAGAVWSQQSTWDEFIEAFR